MRAVIQRVSRASVEVDGQVVAAIEAGLLALVGVAKSDSSTDAVYLARKILCMRVFPDTEGKLNHNVQQQGGSILVVSQFTLFGDMRRGLRPSFDEAAPPALAKALFDELLANFRLSDVPIHSGIFQAHMHVELLNDGPLTILIDSNKLF